MKNNVQINYIPSVSNTNNYNIFESSSCAESFPKMVGNGVLVEYKQTRFFSNFTDKVEINKQSEQLSVKNKNT